MGGKQQEHNPRKTTVRSLTSMILFFCGSLTFPAKQQREMALWIMNLLDLKLGSLYSLGPKAKKKKDTNVLGHVIPYNTTSYVIKEQ